ncbi:MAG: LCP family protein [Faecalimonas sp.]|nr:LCP family protein [Faecalimonas sp.]
MAGKQRSLKEAKAEKAAKKRRARRRKRAIFLLVELMILAILLGIGYVMMKYGKMQLNFFEEGEITVNEGVAQEGYTTIALFGGDSREGQLEEGAHADTIILAAIDNKTKEVRLVSVYRDTLMRQASGELAKANYAYFDGGPQDAINMLNRNLDLDIQHYATVDFKALADVIDLLGGIEIDVTDAEAEAINLYIGETAEVAGKEAVFVSGGLQNLDGVQAVTYARIRKNVGEDYARTERQRLVIQKVAEKAQRADLKTLNQIIDQVAEQVSTSFSLGELMKLAAGATQYKLGENKGFPFELTDDIVEGLGSVVIPLGLAENVQELHAFLYPKDSYQASQTVLDIAEQIAAVTGYTRADYEGAADTNTDEDS